MKKTIIALMSFMCLATSSFTMENIRPRTGKTNTNTAVINRKIIFLPLKEELYCQLCKAGHEHFAKKTLFADKMGGKLLSGQCIALALTLIMLEDTEFQEPKFLASKDSLYTAIFKDYPNVLQALKNNRSLL